MRGTFLFISACLLLLLAVSPACGEEAPYTVKEKETLFAIAKRTEVPLDVLCRANGIQDPSKIRSGMVLMIPRSHTVGRGDTLFAISRQYGVPLDRLLDLNGITDAGKIRSGDKIWIPADKDASPAVAAKPAAADPAAPGKAETAPKAELPVSAAAGPPWKIGSWPHPGRREALRGRLTGLAFYGKQGDDVLSVTRGEVSWVGSYRGLGKALIIRTSDGDQILYVGNESLLVNLGDAVSPGMSIAKLGRNPDGVAKLSFSILTATGKFVEPERISKG